MARAIEATGRDPRARRIMRTSRPSHAASNSPRDIEFGRGDNGAWTRICLPANLPSIRKPPPRKDAMAGRGLWQAAPSPW